jgi:electron transport complex protein RnfG
MSDAANPPKTTANARKVLKDTPITVGIALGLFAMASALALALSDGLTAGPIAEREAEDLRASLDQVLTMAHDNDPAMGEITLDDPQEGTVTLYRATLDGEVTGAAFGLTGYGYGGAIRVLIGIEPGGTLSGVRVLSHAETPGLGDKIEAAKDDWVFDFAGKGHGTVGPDKWKIGKDGGVFDSFSGASITPRAVVGTVGRGLDLFERNETAILAPTGETE